MTTPASGIVIVMQQFNASPDRLFDAWLDPVLAGRWLFTTSSNESCVALIHATPGGASTITDRRDGVDYTAPGQYLGIDPPRRLLFSFGMPQLSPVLTRVVVEIAPRGEGSFLTTTPLATRRPMVRAQGGSF